MEISKCNKPGLLPDCGLFNAYQHITAAATDTIPLSGSHARPQGCPCLAFCLLNSWDSLTEFRWLRRVVLSSVCPTPVQLSSILPFLGLISICFPWNLSFSFLFSEPGSYLGLVQVHSLYLFFGLNSQHATWQEPHQYDTECARFDHRNGPVDDAGEVTWLWGLGCFKSWFRLSVSCHCGPGVSGFPR